MQRKVFLVQNSNSAIQIISYDSGAVLTKIKSMGWKGPFVVRERGIVRLIEIDGKVVERGTLTEKILTDNFPSQTNEWIRRMLESFNC